MARAAAASAERKRIDTHLHLWTPDAERYPASKPIPENLNSDRRGTFESFVKLMDETGISQAVVIQPINYGQDYRYLMAAMSAYPTRLKGMFIADPSVPSEDAAAWVRATAASSPGWVGIRFNPYLWPASAEGGMADSTGKAMFAAAGDLGLVIGFMAFKGLKLHVADIEALLQDSPKTKVIIDHWGFFLQPATGEGDRVIDEDSWNALLQLSKYPQVYVKVSALFRAAADAYPWPSLSDRLAVLLKTYSSSRLMWGSDFPFVTDFAEYGPAARAPEAWPVWGDMSEQERDDLFFNTAAGLLSGQCSESR
ncbi:unnamed protein product [Prorocentrum cordatum]|uniref:Amidohydrolase-related domain-containing protein n=1 Tax=Prorocentrum cordatum TaxID=2364126 RepID=A0ABN9ST80_9DINO|nr:unnamed protein product [Polarella glacialis]